MVITKPTDALALREAPTTGPAHVSETRNLADEGESDKMVRNIARYKPRSDRRDDVSRSRSTCQRQGYMQRTRPMCPYRQR